MTNKNYVKRTSTITGIFIALGILLSSFAYASTSSGSSVFDVSIDRVRVNSAVVAQSRTNLVNDADVFTVLVDLTAVKKLEDAHIEVVLRSRQSSDAVSDSTSVFDMFEGQSSVFTLTLALIDNMRRDTEFELAIKVVDSRGRSEQKSYTIKTESTRSRNALDVSIDRVKVNDKVVAALRNNFIGESDDFGVVVEITALEDLEDARIEAILRDLRSGNVVADATPNFDLAKDAGTSRILALQLIDDLEESSAFELTVKIIDAEGDSVQKIYGIRMEDGASGGSSDSRELDVSIDSVEIEDDMLAEDESNFIKIDEGEEKLDVKVRLTALEDVQDARVEAVLTFENGDVVADATTTFDISDEDDASKKLELKLPSGFGQSSFRLKVKIIDAEGDSEKKEYGLKMNMNDFPFIISSISLNPENNAEAGKAIVATLNAKNSGVTPLDGVVAKVSIPELDVSVTKQLGQLNIGGEEIAEEFILMIPDDTETGTYTVKAEIYSQFDSSSETRSIQILALGKDDQTTQVVNDKLVIKLAVLNQDLNNDGSEAIYPITFTNQGPDANTYTLLFDGSNWANIRLAESNTFVLKPKESNTINVLVSSKEKIKGEQLFTAIVKSDDKVLKELQLKANVIDVSKSLSAVLKGVLEIALIGMVVVLAALGLIFGALEYSSTDEFSEEIPNEESGEAYY